MTLTLECPAALGYECSSDRATATDKRLDVLAVGPFPYRTNGQTVFQLGGIIVNVSLLHGLVDVGHSVRAIATGPPDRRGFDPGDLGPDIPVDWFAVDFLPSFEPSDEEVAKRTAQFEAALDRALVAGRPDVVLLGFESLAMYAPDACRERGLPTVLFSHGVPFPEGNLPPSARATLVGQFDKIDTIVTVAHHLESTLRSFGLSRVRTIRTGVDTDVFRPLPKDPELLAACGIEDDQFVVGSFSRMRPAKRVVDLVSAAELVLQKEPHTVFLIVGDCPHRQETMDLVDEKGLTDSFRFMGEVAYASVPAHMALCDVIVLASDAEGFGLNLLEAQACGIAVIASDIPALLELVDGETNGLRFPVRDVEALAARILRLAADPGLREALQRGSREWALANRREPWVRTCSQALVEIACASVR